MPELPRQSDGDRLGVIERSGEPERVAIRFDGHADPSAMYGRGAMYKGEVEYVRADLHRGAVETIRQARDDLREALKIDANGNSAWLREQVQDAVEAFTAELGGRSDA